MIKNNKNNIEFIVIKEHKSYLQKLCFLIAGLFTMYSLSPKLIENQLAALPITIYVIWFICDFLLLQE